MKNIHHISRCLVLSVTALIFTACEEKLDKSPLDQFDSKVVWTSEENAMLALTGVYRGVLPAENNATARDWWSYSGLTFLEFATDNAYDRRGDNSPYNKLSNGTLTSNINVLSQAWEGSYTRIARCNDFLANIDRVPMEQEKIDRMKAEARFIRGCQYYYLSQSFGAVPLVTDLITKEEANTLNRTPKAEVITFLESEFSEIAEVLPTHGALPDGERGRATRQAALAFLGRVQMADQNFDAAAATYKSIIDLGENIIDPDYPSLFIQSNETSDEHIFSAQFLENLLPNGMYQHFFPAVANGGWHLFCPLNSIVTEYDFKDGTPFSYDDPRYDWRDEAAGRDPRLDYNVLFNGENFQGDYITHPDSASSPDQLGAGKQTTQTGYGLQKFLDEGHVASLRNYGGNLPVIRYAEVLLSYLEAKLEAGDAIDQALLDQTINAVRGRASVDMPPITQTDPTQLRDIVRKERRLEFAFEGIRYWDLLRWGIADEVLQGDFYGAPFPGSVKTRKKGGVTDPYGRWYVTTKNFRMQDYTWPVPRSEVDINPNLE